MTSHNPTSCVFRPLAAKPLPAPIDLNARPSKSPLPIFAPGRSWGRRHWSTGRKPDPCRWIAGGERLPGGLIDFVPTRDLLFEVGFIDRGRPRGGRLSLEFLGHDFLVHSRRKGWLSLIAMPTPERSDPNYTCARRAVFRVGEEFSAPVAAISLINAARKQFVPRF
jgi:hypothetical protein